MSRTLAILSAALLSSILAAAQTPTPTASFETATLNYAFAAQLGSGIYRISDRTIQIYRIPVSFPVVRSDGRGVGVDLRTPVTLGFYDFEPGDILNEGLPEGVNTLSLVPGVTVRVPLGRDWTLLPFADLGAAVDLTSDQWTWVFAAGSELRFERKFGVRTFRSIARLLYTGNFTGEEGSYDDFGELDLGVEARDPLGICLAGHELDLGYFLAAYLYSDTLEFLRTGDGRFEFGSQFEAGFTLGTREPWRVWGVRIPRFGASYRFGQGSPAFRIVFGAPF